jgi:hypothetical protein
VPPPKKNALAIAARALVIFAKLLLPIYTHIVELYLCLGESLLCRLAIPFYRLGIVLGYAFAIVVAHA